MAYDIMMDAGHGGRDPGAVYQGRLEKDDTLRMALAVGDMLQDAGIHVEYTRTSDLYETPYQKAMEANQADVDLFISIHRNAFSTPNTAFGVESLVYDLEGLKLQIAESIDAQLEVVGFVNRGVKERPNLVVLKWTKMPAVLVELGFIDSDIDNRIFDENFNAIAEAIASGILDVLREQGYISWDGKPEIPEKPSGYNIQVGAFRNRTYAERMKKELSEEDFPAFLSDDGTYARVYVGGFQTLEETVSMEKRLKQAGYQTLIVTA